MFHRVKSEVQDSGIKIQQQQSTDADYSQQDEAAPVAAKESAEREEIAAAPVAAAPAVSATRPYETNSTQTQKETKAMEDTIVQGKYSREADARTEAPVAGYSRPSQSAISRPAAYPGSYGVSSPAHSPAVPSTPSYGSALASSASAASSDYAASGDRCLRIGRGINMSGEIEACDHLLVEGTVEAALKGAKVLEIAESGTFYGTVEIEEATIAGRFEGDITVNGRLTISSTGTITGSIAYRELEVEAGAMLDGRMTPLKSAVEAKSEGYRVGSEASAMAKAKDIVAKKDGREAANAEHGLFSKAHAAR